MGSNSTTTNTQPIIQSSDPWGPSQKYLQEIMDAGGSLYGTNAGMALYPGTQNAPLDQTYGNALYSALGLNNAIAENGQLSLPYGQSINGSVTGDSGLYNPSTALYNSLAANSPNTFWGAANFGGNLYSAAPGYFAGANNAFQGIYNNAANNFAPASNIYGGVGNYSLSAPSTSEITLGGAASNGTNNPFLDQLLTTNANRIGNQVASKFSGAGRYGSDGMVDAMNRSIAETNNPILFQAAESAANRQIQASQAMDQARNARLAQALQSAQGLGNAAQAMGQQQLGAAQGLGTSAQGMGQLQLGGAQNYAANLQNLWQAQQAAAQGLGNIAQNTGASQRAWAGMVPQMYQTFNAPYSQNLQLSSVLQNRAQAEQDLQHQLWDQANLLPWTQLARLQGSVTNLAGILGNARLQTTGPQSVTQSTPTPWTSLAGLGIAGAGLLSGSDIRLKTNIVYLGEELGLSIYEYSYKADHNGKRYKGPMAQEVLLKFPNLVANIGGTLYLKAG